MDNQDDIVAGDYVTVHLKFSGYFTGKFGQTQGEGQPIDFIATDHVKAEGGRITDNWHIEDNLTLLQRWASPRWAIECTPLVWLRKVAEARHSELVTRSHYLEGGTRVVKAFVGRNNVSKRSAN